MYSRLPLLLTFVAGILATGAATVPAAAASPGPTPAATLLLPYFEVDLTSPQGLTTLFSVNNAGEEPTIAHVVLWTDWGIPTYSFDVVLAADDVQTINLRDLFTTGTVPATENHGNTSCTSPATAPPLDPAALRAWHTGEDAGDGMCLGSNQGGIGRAVGFVTIDVVSSCSGGNLAFPTHSGYFYLDWGGVPLGGIVAYDDVLWGDAFYVAGDDDSAQGVELVPVPFDPEAVGGETFYRLHSPDGGDRRTMLGTRYRGRYLDGGPFTGGTDLLVWLEPQEQAEPVACGEAAVTPCPDAVVCRAVRYQLFDETGARYAADDFVPEMLAFRFEVGENHLPTASPFGFFDLAHFTDYGPFPPVERVPFQAWVTTVMKADGRYSVGLPATRLPPEEP